MNNLEVKNQVEPISKPRGPKPTPEMLQKHFQKFIKPISKKPEPGNFFLIKEEELDSIVAAEDELDKKIATDGFVKAASEFMKLTETLDLEKPKYSTTDPDVSDEVDVTRARAKASGTAVIQNGMVVTRPSGTADEEVLLVNCDEALPGKNKNKKKNKKIKRAERVSYSSDETYDFAQALTIQMKGN